MHPTPSRLRLALLTLAFACAVALTGVIQQGPRGGGAGAVSPSFVQGWPVKYLAFGKMHLEDISLGVITNPTR